MPHAVAHVRKRMDVQRRTVSRRRCGNDGNDEPKGTRETILFLKTLLYRSFVGFIKTLFRILRFISNLYMRIKRSSRTNTLLYRPTHRATCNYTRERCRFEDRRLSGRPGTRVRVPSKQTEDFWKLKTFFCKGYTNNHSMVFLFFWFFASVAKVAKVLWLLARYSSTIVI